MDGLERDARAGWACCAAQSPRVLTGIDFVQVVNPAVQTRLRVFFLIEPDDVTPVLVTPATLVNAANGATDIQVSITPLTAGSAPVEVTRKDWRRVTLDSLTRICLEVVVAAPGGFEPYRLTLTHVPPALGPNQLDPFSSSVVFDFKQACETGFDCEHHRGCPHDPGVDFPVDYLARDFGSLRRALLDFAAQRHPDWREPIVADMGVMMLEIMAALGDEFAYAQDRYDAETRFGSATQRASLLRPRPPGRVPARRRAAGRRRGRRHRVGGRHRARGRGRARGRPVAGRRAVQRRRGRVGAPVLEQPARAQPRPGAGLPRGRPDRHPARAGHRPPAAPTGSR